VAAGQAGANFAMMEEWEVVEQARDRAEFLLDQVRDFVADEWLRARFHLLMHGLVHATPGRNLAPILRERELSPGAARPECEATYRGGSPARYGRDSVCFFDFEAAGLVPVVESASTWRPVLFLSLPRRRLALARKQSPFEDRASHPDDLVVLFQLVDPKVVADVRKGRRPPSGGPIEIPAVELRFGGPVCLPETTDLHFLVPGKAWWTVDLQVARRLSRLPHDELLSRVLEHGR